jgi:hypothetical protein
VFIDAGTDSTINNRFGQAVTQGDGVAAQIPNQREAQQEHDDGEGQRGNDGDVFQTVQCRTRVVSAGQQHDSRNGSG